MATAYPFDPTGTSAANRILNEQHVITAQNFRDYHYVIPNFAPFFEDNFTIKLQYPSGTVRNLVRGIDYYFSNQFLDASRACSRPVFGSISFLDTDTAGILSISYNTVGGKWNVTAAEITRILAEEMRNPRTTTWEQITNLPERFPVIDHQWDLVDMVGVSPLIAAIDTVRTAIMQTNGGGLAEHVSNYSNPHNVTKLQVGLGDVLNFPVATLQQAQEGTSTAAYMTPANTAAAIQTLAGNLVTAHANNPNNPHNTTKAQVGLDRVQNYPIAIQSQAETGAVDTAYMTPLRTAQAVAAQVGTAYNAHAANKLNPHNVTKEQIGLFNVENFAVASQEEARAGTANDRYMTPRRTTQLVQELVSVQLDGHAMRVDNPHDTTAAQVGAYSITQTDTLLANYVRNNDLWVAGKSKDAFIAEVLTGTAANATLFDNKSVTQVLQQGTSIYDTLYSRSLHAFSRDKVFTADPVTNPNRWIRLGIVSTLSSVETGSINSISATFPDVYWLFAGGQHQLDGSNNAGLTSAAYLIHAKNGATAQNSKVNVTQLNRETASDVQFGYTFESTTNTLSVWVKVAYGYNDINLTKLTNLASAQELDGTFTIQEPLGIEYVTPVMYATKTELDAVTQVSTELTNRVTAIETLLNSVSVV